MLLTRATSNNITRVSALSRPVALSQRLCSTGEKVTHTGQAYDEGDYRKLRFVDREKEVNEQFAINLVDEEPPVEIQGSSVWCDGGGGPLGHPKVYINLDQEGPHPCGYCGLRYVAAKHWQKGALYM